ncbi:MAG: amidohydrolase [Leucobacter sp.]
MSAGRGDGRERLFVGSGLTTMSGATGDGSARAIAVRDGVIVAVGGVAEARDALSAGAEEIDLDGHILPGMNDAHAHVAPWGTWLPPFSIDLGPSEVSSIAELRERIAAKAATVPDGAWIRGHGWNAEALRECAEHPGRQPSRHDLDGVSPRNPVVLDDDNLHAYWVNSEALRLAGVDASTADPPGGTIRREPGGEPSGVLMEFSARGLIDRVMPPFTREERKQGIGRVVRELHRLGFTSFTEPGIGPGGGGAATGLESLRAYEELAAAGELGIRASILLLLGEGGVLTAEHVREGLGSVRLDTHDERRLRLAGVKVFADGIPPFHTAWMHEDYEDAPTRGALTIPGADDGERTAELTEIVRAIHDAGLQAGIHATGDATIDASVTAIVAARRARPELDPRHYIIHADLLSPETIATMAEFGIGVSSQMELLAHVHEHMVALVGEERSSRQYPNRSLLDAGVPLAFGSDMPVAASADWRRAAAVAVLRRSALTGETIGEAQRIGVLEALHAYTLGGARQDRAERWKGSLEVGKAADLCVVRRDPLATEPEALPELGIVGTVVDGELVHTA